ncbi:MAG: hypothetical protein SP1CHLAM54_11280 [Chlamydiia bacterium]|nr:hypothetical protein [Chlamydiia bacterium]MCH9616031.1 hypothetical protein [Chlamydiia bacterium]MCH9629054.1 hypothetical protein [Chlamydiia bacterium]
MLLAMAGIYFQDQLIEDAVLSHRVAIDFPDQDVQIDLKGSTVQIRPDDTQAWVDFSSNAPNPTEALQRALMVERVDRLMRAHLFETLDEEERGSLTSIETAERGYVLKRQALETNEVMYTIWSRDDFAWYEKIIGFFAALGGTFYYGLSHGLYLTFYS